MQGLALKGLGALKGAGGALAKKLGLGKLIGKYGGWKGIAKKFGLNTARRLFARATGAGRQPHYGGLGGMLGGYDPMAKFSNPAWLGAMGANRQRYQQIQQFNPFDMRGAQGLFTTPGSSADRLFGGPLQRPMLGMGMGMNYMGYMQQQQMQMNQWSSSRAYFSMPQYA